MLVKLPNLVIDTPIHYIVMEYLLSVCMPKYDDVRAPYVTAQGFLWPFCLLVTFCSNVTALSIVCDVILNDDVS